MSRFTDKVVIITGSSSGIGRAAAILFAKEGAKVTITGRNENRLKATSDAILSAGALDSQILSVCGDVTSPETQKSIVEQTVARFGGIDVLVNNAGAAHVDKEGKVGFEASLEVLQSDLKLNLISVLQMSQLARPHLIERKGEIINISSIVALHFAFQNMPYYAIAKAAVDQATRALSIDLIQHGVRVNSINPGIVATQFLANVGIPETATSKVYDYYGGNPDCVPSGKSGTPEEIASVIAFLADRTASSYIVGQTLIADGGSSLIMAMNTHDIGKILMQ